MAEEESWAEHALERDFSPQVRAKAADVVPEPHESDPTVWWVASLRTDRRHRVQVVASEWVVCDCTNGTRRGGRAGCYHAAAVLMRMGAEEESNDGGESDG